MAMFIRQATGSCQFFHQFLEKRLSFTLYNHLILLQLSNNKIQIRSLKGIQVKRADE